MFNLSELRWYHATRAIGAFCLIYGILGDHTPERSTLILTGAGLLGLDKVARSEPSNHPKDKSDE